MASSGLGELSVVAKMRRVSFGSGREKERKREIEELRGTERGRRRKGHSPNSEHEESTVQDPEGSSKLERSLESSVGVGTGTEKTVRSIGGREMRGEGRGKLTQ